MTIGRRLVSLLSQTYLRSCFATTPTKLTKNVVIQDMRVQYKQPHEAFVESHLVSQEPFGQFHAWFEEAKNNSMIKEPNAMCLSTATKDGIPSARFVLLKSYGPEGFKFFTNGISRKGKELDENPNAALTFYWDPLNRQIRIEGKVEKLPESEATEYFKSRPLKSQIGAAVSEQSSAIPSRDFLIERSLKLLSETPEGQTVDKPPSWCGYKLIAERVEFWQGQSDRIHDRILFSRKTPSGKITEFQHEGTEGWIYERLAP